MSVMLSEDAKVIAMLCVRLQKSNDAQPLTQEEYSTLVAVLLNRGLRPSDLYADDNFVDVVQSAGLNTERVQVLMARGLELGLALEEWQRQGIWLITRSDALYPKRLKQKLKDKAPPLLFGCGNKELLNGGGIAVVGSRNVDDSGQRFARTVGVLSAYDHVNIVSGGARGVDEAAQEGALSQRGNVISILADSLIKKSVAGANRNSLSQQRLLLLSPSHPGAGFNAGNAMARNKLVYAMADTAVVVNADYNKGGTWSGATEELKRDNAIPVFVRMGETISEGNKHLLEEGAQPFPSFDPAQPLFDQLLSTTRELAIQQGFTQDLFATAEVQHQVSEQENSSGTDTPATIYERILPMLIEQLHEPCTIDDLTKALNIRKTQLQDWLNQAIANNHIEKLTKPVRYRRV